MSPIPDIVYGWEEIYVFPKSFCSMQGHSKDFSSGKHKFAHPNPNLF